MTGERVKVVTVYRVSVKNVVNLMGGSKLLRECGNLLTAGMGMRGIALVGRQWHLYPPLPP
jgi:hypothetical protein